MGQKTSAPDLAPQETPTIGTSRRGSSPKKVSFIASNDGKSRSKAHRRYDSATAPHPSPTPMLNPTPQLPIPKLDDTCNRFIETVRPLLSHAEFEATQKRVHEFLNDQGPKLQSLLQRMDANMDQKSNYVEKWWTRSYLEGNDPVVFNVNPYFILADGADPAVKSRQCVQAASLLESSLRFALSVRTNTLTPDMARTTPLDMSQYPLLFNSARIPSPPCTTSVSAGSEMKGISSSSGRYVAGFVCMVVCVLARVCLCVCIYVSMCMSLCLYVYVYMSLCLCICLYVYVCM
jgi:hypothetical protein